jgi:hypothetical protein
LSSSNTNQTGTETGRPDFLPVTVMVISLDLERRSFKESFGDDMCTPIQMLLVRWAGTFTSTSVALLMV